MKTMTHPFIGAYWSQRKEDRSACARRLATCLEKMAQIDPVLRKWFQKRKSLKQAMAHPVDTEPADLERLLKSHKRDIGKTEIPDLGFNFSVWNGDPVRSASLAGTCGAYAPVVGNAVVLNLPELPGDVSEQDRARFKLLMNIIVEVWEPDTALVSSSETLAQSPGSKPWEASPWFLYHRHYAGIQ